jgi:hypothetical protein
MVRMNWAVSWTAAACFPDSSTLVSRLRSAYLRTQKRRDEGYSNLGGLGVSA